MIEDDMDRITELMERIEELEATLKASRGWWERLRVAEARVAALEAAARVVLDEMTGRTVPKGTHLWCNWCDSTPIGSTDPRMEERDYTQHYAECPVGKLAMLLGESA